MVMERALGRSLPDIEVVSSNAAKAIRNEKFMLHLQQEGRSANAGRAYFFSPAVKLVTMVTDWLTCCVTQSRRNFLPSGRTSLLRVSGWRRIAIPLPHGRPRR